MRGSDLARLIALGAIWGASFLFMRIVAPALGPIATADARMLIAGAALALWFRFSGYDAGWRRWWAQYAIIGTINTAIPFMLFAYAALSLGAGEMAVFNATAPMWGAALSAVFLGERLSARRVAGLALGIGGVALISAPASDRAAWLPSIAALAASAFYGFAGVYLRGWAPGAPAKGLAGGTQLAAALLVLPLVAAWPPVTSSPTLPILASVLALGLLCSAVAYVLYFRLVADLGPTGALTVTYLIPLFAILWGAVFLDERPTLTMMLGAALVIVGTLLVLARRRPGAV